MSFRITISSWPTSKPTLSSSLGSVAQALEQLRVHAGDALRRAEQPLALRILADGLDDLAHGALNPLQVNGPGQLRNVAYLFDGHC